MPLPNYDEFLKTLTASKGDNQSWGEFFRELNSTSSSTAVDAARAYLTSSGLIKVLSEWDFYSSPALDQAALDLDVKSWQITEFIEGIREALNFQESDLIVYEAKAANLPVPVTINESSQVNQISVGESIANGVSSAEATVAPSSSQPVARESLELAHHPEAPGSPKSAVFLTGVAAGLVVLGIILIAIVSSIKQNISSTASSSSSPGTEQPASQENDTSTSSNYGNSHGTQQESNAESIYFSGIDLPVTNRLCNKKNTFCIYNLATLVNRESGEASYTYSDVSNGQQVNINGTITISNIEKSGGNRNFTFAFRDDQNNTTPGWAAAGYFNLDQDKDPAKKGILTRFKTTESFGPKTPVGLENTSYLFPN